MVEKTGLPLNLRWWQIALLALLALVLINSLTGQGADAPPDQLRDPAAAPAFTEDPEPISEGGHFSATIAPNATPESLTAAARDFCAKKSWCMVMGWNFADDRAQGMPMVSREAETMAFQYLLNRAGDVDEARWDCELWPGAASSCLAD